VAQCASGVASVSVTTIVDRHNQAIRT